MFRVVKENPAYFACVAVFALLGGLYLYSAGRPDAVLFFSDHRTVEGDTFFKLVTHLGEGPVYFVAGVLALFYRPRYSLLVAATGLSVMAFSAGLKAFFAQDRPLAFFEKTGLAQHINLVSGVDVHTGPTSFPSGHAMSAFALYGLLVFLLPTKKTYAFAGFATALLIALSRVYLVQHFWCDVYVGALVGTLIAWLVYYLYQSHFDRPMSGLANAGE